MGTNSAQCSPTSAKRPLPSTSTRLHLPGHSDKVDLSELIGHIAEINANLAEKTSLLTDLLTAFAGGHRVLLKNQQKILHAQHEVLKSQGTLLRALQEEGEFSVYSEDTEYTSTEDEECEYEGPARKKRRTEYE